MKLQILTHQQVKQWDNELVGTNNNGPGVDKKNYSSSLMIQPQDLSWKDLGIMEATV